VCSDLGYDAKQADDGLSFMDSDGSGAIELHEYLQWTGWDKFMRL